MTLSQREKIASVIAFITMMCVAVAPQRSFLMRGARFFDFHWSQILANFAVVACVVLLWPEIKYRHDIKKLLRIGWPLLVYTLTEIIFLIFGFLHKGAPGIEKSFPLSWWFNYGTMLFFLLGAYILGYLVRWDAHKQAKFLATVFATLTLIVLGEYLYGSGLHNSIGALVHFLNANTDRIWQWSPSSESLRVTALYAAPTLLAMATLSGMVWSLSANYSRVFRVILFLDSAFIMLLTASRAEFLAAAVLLVCSALIKIQNRGFKVWIKRSMPVLMAVLLIFLVGAGVYSHNLSKKYSAGLFTRIATYEKGEAKDESINENQKTFLTKLDQLSSGRVFLWAEAFKVIEQHPYGTGMPSGCYLTRAHAHNDFLAKYIQQGILGIIMIVVILAWMSSQQDSEYSADLGLYFAITIFAVGLMDCAFAQSPVLLLPLFLLGLNAGNTR